MNKRMTTMEAKIDGLKAHKDDTFDSIESKLEYALDRMEGAEKSTSEKIDDHGLIISSIKRGMERLYDLNKRDEETAKTVEKKINSYEIMLRRILGFHETLMNLVDHQKQLGRGVQDLLDAAYPSDDEGESNAQNEETATQYDNDDNNMEKLGAGPAPTLFVQSSNPSYDSVPFPSAAIPTPSVKVTTGSSASTGPPSTGPPSTGPPSTELLSTAPGPTEPAPMGITATVPAPTESLPGIVEAQVSSGVTSPNITMTTATPINSQDVDQATTTIISNQGLLPPPPNDPPLAEHLSPPTAADETKAKAKRLPSSKPVAGGRRSPRIQENSRAPSPAVHTKRRSAEDDEEGDAPKRRKVVPS
jgi:hypothetical protein